MLYRVNLKQKSVFFKCWKWADNLRCSNARSTYRATSKQKIKPRKRAVEGFHGYWRELTKKTTVPFKTYQSMEESTPSTKWALDKGCKGVFSLIKSLHLQNFRALPFQLNFAKIIKENEAKQIGENKFPTLVLICCPLQSSGLACLG